MIKLLPHSLHGLMSQLRSTSIPKECAGLHLSSWVPSSQHTNKTNLHCQSFVVLNYLMIGAPGGLSG